MGFTLYFLVVFVVGGLLLIGLAAYLGWELVTRRRHPNWSDRTRFAKLFLAFSGLLFAWLLFIPLRMIRLTRVGAVAGLYTSSGVWGAATLDIGSDGTFVETWRFKNEYNGSSEGEGVIGGAWRDRGRDWLTRDIEFERFRGLAEYDRKRVAELTGATVKGYGGVTSLEVDAGSGIVFR